MKLFNFIKIALLTLCVYHAQAASLTDALPDAPAPAAMVAVPKVAQQIADWDAIFAAHPDVLTAAHMPTLMGKVDELTAYVKPVMQGAEVSIIDRYAGELRAAHEASALTFDLYTRYFMAMVRLLTPMDWCGTQPMAYEDLASPLASAEWLDAGYERKSYCGQVKELIAAGVHPYFILTPKGHLGYERIVGGYLEREIPIHFIGLPLELTRGHGQTWSVDRFVEHDLSHGILSVAQKIETIKPLARSIFQSICAEPAHSPVRRELMVALYFWLHELEHAYEDDIRAHLAEPAHVIGKCILDKVKHHFMDDFLSNFLKTAVWCKPFQLGDRVVWPNMLPNTSRIEDSTMHLEATLSLFREAVEFHLERHTYSIGIPAEISGPYEITITRLESYVDRLTAQHGDAVLAPYKQALEAFYRNCERVGDDVSKFTLNFGDPSKPSFQQILEETFKQRLADEWGTKAFVETGKYDPELPPYTWDTVFAVRQLYDRIFTALQKYAVPIWQRNSAEDPAIIASMEPALVKLEARAAARAAS